MSSDRVLLGHGGGGLLTARLVEEVILPVLSDPVLLELEDAAVVPCPSGDLAFTTDTYVVTPLFFPGGDIGKLAVCGTVNDLAVKGARPLWMSLGLVLEEGLLLSDLRRAIESLGQWARAAGIRVVTGDTKVVERGSCDGMYLATAGIGAMVATEVPRASRIQPGDAVIVNGFLADHGVTVMAARSGLSFAGGLESDCAPLWGLVEAILGSGAEVHAMRDLTRGGLAGALCDLARASSTTIQVDEDRLLVRPAVRGACNLLGLEPMVIANEGKLVLFCPAEQASAVLDVMRQHEYGAEAAVIGTVTAEEPGLALLRTALGGARIIDMPVGENLPRIC